MSNKKDNQLINENVRLINTKTGRTIATGTVEKIENVEEKIYIILKNNTKKIAFRNITIQYIIL